MQCLIASPGLAPHLTCLCAAHRFDQVRFTRSADEAGTKDVNAPDTGLVQALLFDVKDRNQIGYVTPGRGRHFCCSPELVSKTGCSPGKLIVKPTAGDNQVKLAMQF
jgi:hypothetical protein